MVVSTKSINALLVPELKREFYVQVLLQQVSGMELASISRKRNRKHISERHIQINKKKHYKALMIHMVISIWYIHIYTIYIW